MAKLVDDLKREHAVLIGTLDVVYKLGVASTEAQSRLAAAKSGLLAHLRKEDVHLYPALKAACTNNAEVSNTVKRFIADMDTISGEALDFFAKYSKDGAGGSDLEFARDFGRLSGTLKSRMQREEASLYPLYEKIVKA